LLLVTAGRVGHLLGSAFRDHTTDLVGDRLVDRLRNHPTDFVGDRLVDRLGHHMTDLVGDRLVDRLRHHMANLVGHCLVDLLVDHVTNLVSTSLDTLLRYHVADPIVHDFLVLLGRVMAYRIGNGLGDHFTLVTNAVDRLLLDSRNPRSVADLPRRALHLHHSRCAWRVDAAATAWVPSPATWLLHASLHDGARNRFDIRIPVTCANVNDARVMHWLADRLADFAGAGFVDWFANVVTNSLRSRFPDRLAYRVANLLRSGFPNRFANVVANVLGSRFPNWLADRVTDVFRPGFPHWLAYRVAKIPRSGFPDWATHGVADVFRASVPHGPIHRVVAGPVMSFIDRLANRIGAFAIPGFRHVSDTIDDLLVIDCFVCRPVTGVLLLVVDDLAAILHYGVTLLLRTAVAGWIAPRTIAVACHATIRGGGTFGR